MMGYTRDILTISRWEIRRAFGTMGKNVIPVALILLVLLIAVTGFTAKSGLHIQDGIYHVGTDQPDIAGLLSGDSRFSTDLAPIRDIEANQDSYDLVITNDTVYVADTDRGKSAAATLSRDYSHYLTSVYNQENDLFAAYPLWIDLQSITSELDFTATQSGQQISVRTRTNRPPLPTGPVEPVPTPAASIGVTSEELRTNLQQTSTQNSQLSRYTDIFSGSESPLGTFKTPDQLSPPLPFDSIILVFVFIFPLYFMSQFYMMSIMNERIGRRGETLLSTPVHPSAIIIGKALPYFAGMIIICAALTLWLKAPLLILVPLVPVILFFLATALLIGMMSRSFKELSFISIFFSTVATSYLFFPSIFANIHVISMISPLTLIILSIQGTAYTALEYLYSTSLFWLTGLVLFYIGVVNFREERLFSQEGLLTKVGSFVSTALSAKHPYVSLFLLNALLIPAVFMVQLLLLVLFFNLPMPASLILLLIGAAFVEEVAKSIGIWALMKRAPTLFTWRTVVIASAATALGFLIGEKLLLFVTLSQISQSVFGSVLFTSLGSLWMPLLLHFGCVLIVAASIKKGGRIGYLIGLIAAVAIHCVYNVYIIFGWLT
jgi:ABC-type Na+ efflux pump permease subunit